MGTAKESQSAELFTIAPLAAIVERQQIWSRMAEEYGVESPIPPWKSSLDGICDALDQSSCGTEVLSLTDRRDEEDRLSSTVYADLPYPENQLVALAHSLIVHGVIDANELQQRLTSIRTRLEA